MLTNIIHDKWLHYYRTNIIVQNLYNNLINEQDMFGTHEEKQRWIANKKSEILLITDNSKIKEMISNTSHKCWIEINNEINNEITNYSIEQVKIDNQKTFVNINLPINSSEIDKTIHLYVIKHMITPVIIETKELLVNNKFKLDNDILSKFYSIMDNYNYNIWKLINPKLDSYQCLDDFEKLQVKKLINLMFPTNKLKYQLDISLFESYPIIPRDEITFKNFLGTMLIFVIMWILSMGLTKLEYQSLPKLL